MATWFDKLLKRNTGKEAISQYWNPTGGDGTGDYEAVEGSSGAPKMQADDGKIASIGAKADEKVIDADATANVIQALKGQLDRLNSILTAVQGATPAGTNNIGDVDIVTMPAVAQGTPAADGSPWPVKVTGSSIPDAEPVPVKTVKRGSVTTQTHNAVSVGASAIADSAVLSVAGYSDVAVGLRSDASHTRGVTVLWYADAGSTYLGNEVMIATASAQTGVGRVTVKAPYCKVSVSNGDASPHTISTYTTMIP